MAERRKPAAKPDPDFDALMDLCRKDAGMGVSFELDDQVTWVDDDFEISYWRLALEAIDQRGDKRLLLNLLRQNEELLKQMEADAKDENFYADDFTPTARHHLANLLERYNLKLSPSGRRKSPLGNSPWHQALSAMYTTDDKQPLIKLLESTAEISSADRSDFAYLLEQYDLTRPRGRREQPSYELSPIEKKLLVARREVRSLVQAGQRVKDAVTRVARERRLGKDQLYNSYAGTRGGTRRAIKRAKE
jgi:hypothetical protein